jgi:hypothetical protein
MIGFFLPRPVRLELRKLKVAALLVLLLALLGFQRSCTESAPTPPTCTLTAPAAQRPEAVLPVFYRVPVRSRQWVPVPVADTGRAGGPAYLLRKASPRSRWLPAQPAYLPPLQRRPKQRVLDSTAAASMRRA